MTIFIAVMGKGNNQSAGVKSSCFLFSKKILKKIIKNIKKVVDFLQIMCYYIYNERGTPQTKKELKKMKNYTTLVKTNGIATKIIKSETEVEAIISAWEEKMNGNTVTVLDEKAFEIIYR